MNIIFSIRMNEMPGPVQLLRQEFDSVMQEFMDGKCPNGEPTADQVTRLVALAESVGSVDTALAAITMPNVPLGEAHGADRDQKFKGATVFRSKLAMKVRSALETR